MSADGTEYSALDGATRWWQLSLWHRSLVSGILWSMLALSSVGTVIGALCVLLAGARARPDVRETLGFAALAVFSLLTGRVWTIGAAVSGGYLLVRRAIPGRVERIPISSIRRAEYRYATWIRWQSVIRVFVPPLGFLLIAEYHSLFGTEGAESWQQLTADLHQALGDRWRE